MAKSRFSVGSVYFNIIVLGLTLFFSEMSWNSTQNFLNIDKERPGQEGLSDTVYRTSFQVKLTCITITTVVFISRVGLKPTLLFGLFSYELFSSGSLLPVYGLFIPMAVIGGIGAAFVSVTWPTFVTILGKKMAAESSCRSLAGNIVVSMSVCYVFKYLADFVSFLLPFISIMNLSAEYQRNVTVVNPYCGGYFCYRIQEAEIFKMTDQGGGILTACLIACAVAAFLIAITGLDRAKETEKVSCKHVLRELWNCLKTDETILMIPTMIYVGFLKYFIVADFTKAYVLCDWGVYHVFPVLICYSVVGAVFSGFMGSFFWLLDRSFLFLAAAVIQVGTLAALWNVSSDTSYMYYVVAVAFGISDAIWQVQVKSFIGVTFHERPVYGFAVLGLFETLGIFLMSCWADYICMKSKLIILAGFLSTGLLGYVVAELVIRKEARKQESSNHAAYLNMVAPPLEKEPEKEPEKTLEKY